MKMLFRKILKDQQGQVLMVFVVIFTVLCIFWGFVVDIWIITFNTQKLQDGVDLATLSAAQQIPISHGKVESTAIYIAEKNGIHSNELTITHPYNGDNNKVQLSAIKTINLIMLPIIGYRTKTISARAVAVTDESSHPIFGYAFFSASTEEGVKSSFSDTIFDGKVHSNNNFETSGGKNVFKDDLEVVGTIDLKDDTVFNGNVINPASIISIPEYDINKLKEKATTVYTEDVSFSGGTLNLNGIMFVDGDVSIDGGCDVQGKGSIIATGKISITGGSTLIYNSDDDFIALYSLISITVTGGNDTFNGILYSPNGEVVLTGGNSTFYGSVIGNTIRISNGGYKFIYDSRVKDPFGGENEIKTHLVE